MLWDGLVQRTPEADDPAQTFWTTWWAPWNPIERVRPATWKWTHPTGSVAQVAAGAWAGTIPLRRFSRKRRISPWSRHPCPSTRRRNVCNRQGPWPAGCPGRPRCWRRCPSSPGDTLPPRCVRARSRARSRARARARSVAVTVSVHEKAPGEIRPRGFSVRGW